MCHYFEILNYSIKVPVSPDEEIFNPFLLMTSSIPVVTYSMSKSRYMIIFVVAPYRCCCIDLELTKSDWFVYFICSGYFSSLVFATKTFSSKTFGFSKKKSFCFGVLFYLLH